MSGHRNRFERYGPDGPFDDRTGNGIVNNGPDNELGGLGEALGGDEEALRRLMQGAVQDLEPSEGTLDHLRKAVPARRARKRQALVGVAAAAVLMGTAVPTFVHVASSGSSESANPVNAGHGEQAQGGTGAETGDDGGEKGTDQPTGGPDGTPTSAPGSSPAVGPRPGTGTGDGGTGDTAVPPGVNASDLPVCDPAQLGGTSTVGAPDAEGKVYGTFRVANVSTTECMIKGQGNVGYQAMGAAERDKIQVQAHTTGDAASGLPDPSQEAPELLLAPSAAYEVKFAWVPSDTCPTPGSPEPTPTDGGSGATTTGTGASAENAQTQLLAEDGVSDGSVEVTHVPEAGAPGAGVTVPNACAGTIYRTGLLNAS